MNRSERRKNPDQWWRVVAFAREDKEVQVQGGSPVYVRGNVEDVTVVQLPEDAARMQGSDLYNYMRGVEAALMASGIENALIVPRGVEFVGLRPLSHEESLTLSIRKRGSVVKKQDLI